MTLTRRFMMRITDRIREERCGLVIINGESLGQVASQTMESMQAINAVTCTPVIRPVVTMDKLEIIDLAQKSTHLISPSNLLRIAVPFLHLTVQKLIQKSRTLNDMKVVWMLKA